MKRDDVIQQVATSVRELAEGWTVDLKNPDVLILVDVYRNVLGMSVVGEDYERLKRFNLAEIESSPLGGWNAGDHPDDRTQLKVTKQEGNEERS